jgi:GntR family transcriptional repressor for pyruvate dehydrogenase complex
MTARSPQDMAKVFTSIKAVNRSVEVKSQLMRAIEGGDFKPGEQLPSERELGEAFGVSRVSVREAIRALEAIGLVEVFQGRGCFVSRGPVERYPKTLVRWLQLHRSEVLELLMVRGALDAVASAEAATNGTDEQFARMREISDGFAAAAAKDPLPLEELVEHDVELHLTIAEASGSALLRELLGNLNDQLTESRRLTFALPGRLDDSIRGHTAIVDAISARDRVAARAAVEEHMSSGGEALVDAMQSLPPQDT